ncbi:SMC family ATPase [Scytonema sp. NUACC21]
MRALELSLEGFTSFRSRETLDFSQLDLFAITGPTGAGKTSLLDAITFALYGHVARFGKDANARELVSLGSQNLKVSFRFSVRGVEYRVTRTWRDRPKTPESKALLERLQSNDSWEKLETKEKSVTKRVEQVLAMDYETFTRVILLPQGKFDEFIKGDKTKRRSILRDLAGFQIFERMRQQAQGQADSFKKEYQILERQLEEFELPTPEEVAEKQQQFNAIQEQIPVLSQAVLKAQKALDEEEDLFKKIERLVDLRSQLNQLTTKSEQISELTLRLQQAQASDGIKDTYALVKAARDRYKKAQADAISTQRNLSQAKQKLDQQKTKRDEITEQQKQMEPQFKAREEALTAARNHDEQRQHYQTELARTRQILTQRQENLSVAKQELNRSENQLQAASQQIEEVEKELTQYSPGGIRLEQLRQVSTFLGSYKLLQEQTNNYRQKLNNATLDKQKAEKKYQEALVKLERVISILQEKQRLLQEAETANYLALQSNHAAALRESLHDGDRCPVCQGTYLTAQLLPLPNVEQVDTTELSSQKELAEKEYTATEKAVAKAETNLENSKQQESESQQELVKYENQLTELQQKISSVLQTEGWEVNALNQEFQELQESDRSYHQALAKQKDAAAQVRETQQALQATRNTHATALTECDIAQQDVNRWEQQLEQVEAKLDELTGGKSYADLQTELEKDKQKLEQQLQQATDAYQAADKRAIQYEAEDKKARDDADAARLQEQQLQSAWQVALVSAGFTEETFVAARADSRQQSLWQEQISDYDAAKVQVETRIEEVKSQVGDRTTNKSAINSLRDAKNEADAQLNQAQNQLAQLMAWMQGTESKQKQAEKRQQELSLVKKQAETYTTLARSLKTDEFQAFALEHLERELVSRATNVLQELTDSRYALKIQDGEYSVEDNWNGGESRRVQTLSGGETFATSLSMALALSEKLSMGAELGSLFLDEGFGTLDAETLETVFQILQTLRQQDRLIGVITHVKALGDRLPQVKVYKRPEGSRIEVDIF